MSHEIVKLGPAALELKVEGVLDADDYRDFTRKVESIIERHGYVNLLVRIARLRGWTPAALWRDLKFDVKHYNDVSRLALVGESDSEEWMAAVSKPFTGAEVRYFPLAEIEAARHWTQKAPAGGNSAPA